ncbi:unnamed protein product [Mortierella alpina]
MDPPPGVPRTSPDCRRCLHDAPDAPPAFESHNHAFYSCPSVLALWNQTIEWIRQMLPQLQLSIDPNQLLLAWPATKQLPPLAIHLHSVVTHSIYRTYCKLGDGEKLFPNQLMWMAISGLQTRARTELERAKTREREQEEQEILAAKQDRPFNWIDHIGEFVSTWHCPPHIVATEDAVSFGDMWRIPDPDPAAPARPPDPDLPVGNHDPDPDSDMDGQV